MGRTKPQFRCPTCKRPVEDDGGKTSGYFPFCSERCKLLDLGKWLDDAYRIPGKDLGEDEPPANAPPDSADEKSS